MSLSYCAVNRCALLLLLEVVFLCNVFPAIKRVARIYIETVSPANIAVNGSPHEAFYAIRLLC